MPFFIPLIALSAAWAAECTPVPAATIHSHAEAASRAFFAEDEGAFTAALDALRRDLRCAEALTAEDAEAVHLAFALDAIYPRDELALDAHLRAVLALQPAFDFSADQAPPGGPLDRALQAARGSTRYTPIPVTTPCGDALPLTLDGTAANGWSGDRAAIAQLSEPLGAPILTTILLPGAANPFADVSCPTERVGPQGRGLALAGLGLSVTAGAAWGIAAWNDAQADTAFDAIATGQDPGMSPETLQAHVTRANAASFAAIGLGIGGVTLGATWILRF